MYEKLTKFPIFTGYLLEKNATIMCDNIYDNCPKNIFPIFFFWGGGVARAPLPPAPVSYAYVTETKTEMILRTGQGHSDGGILVYNIYPQNQSKYTFYGVEMTPQRLLNMSIEVLYLPKKFIPPTPKNKQISGYAPGTGIALAWSARCCISVSSRLTASSRVLCSVWVESDRWTTIILPPPAAFEPPVPPSSWSSALSSIRARLCSFNTLSICDSLLENVANILRVSPFPFHPCLSRRSLPLRRFYVGGIRSTTFVLRVNWSELPLHAAANSLMTHITIYTQTLVTVVSWLFQYDVITDKRPRSQVDSWFYPCLRLSLPLSACWFFLDNFRFRPCSSICDQFRTA